MLALTLASCAPTIAGSQSYSPIMMSSAVLPVLATPGQTIFVQYTYPRSAFTIAKSRFDELKIDFRSTTMNGNVASPEARAEWLNMTPVDLPDGWQISLVNAMIRKEIDKTETSSRDINVQYYERVTVTYKISVPTNAKSFASVTLNFKDGSTAAGEIPMFISTSGEEGRFPR